MKEHYTDTIFYQIELTAKYCKMLGAQVFELYKTGISVEEYTVLDTLLSHPELCQRDLAKLILKDRANTGKLLDGLEKKGLVTRKLAIKNNRPVKIIEITTHSRRDYSDLGLKRSVAIGSLKLTMPDVRCNRCVVEGFLQEHEPGQRHPPSCSGEPGRLVT